MRTLFTIPRGRVPGRSEVYGAWPEQAKRLLAHGFTDERTDDSRMELGLVLHENPSYFRGVRRARDGSLEALQIFEVIVTAPPARSEAFATRVCGVPTDKSPYPAAVLNEHATWRPVSRDDVDTPEARRALEESEAAHMELLKQKGRKPD